MRRKPVHILVAFLLMILCPMVTSADDTRPLYVEINEIAENTYTLRVKIPPNIPAGNRPRISFPANCAEVRDPRLPGTTRDRAAERIGQLCYRCEESLAGRAITVDYPGATPPNSSLIKFITQQGAAHTVILSPQERSWQIPEAETRSGVARDYTRLGIYHIWEGKDHLLFLVCLLWIAGDLRRVLTTITGFTVAHSITLALSALEIVCIAVPPVEAVIALSVVFLAMEIAKGKRENLTWKHPIAVSSSFGLLHGLGFAAVLNEIGLPQTELVTGLLFFNVGVEIGQVLFALVVLFAIFAVKKIFVKWASDTPVLEARLQLTMSYAVGITASYWLIERVANF